MRVYYDDYGSFVKEHWLPYDTPEFPREDPPFTVTKIYKGGKAKTTQYVRVNLSLDIETTTVGLFSAPYIMTVSLNRPHTNQFFVYHMRNWLETQALLDAIAEHYKLGKNRKTRTTRSLICFVHNLSYEFYFCRFELDFDFGKWGFFSKENRKAMKAALKNGIEFRDSLALTNCSLEQTSKMYTLHKKIKDLDYSVQRNTKTPLTDQELRYINEDCIILNEFSDTFFDKMCMQGEKPPLTNTARLLLRVKKAMLAEGFNKAEVSLIQPSAVQILKEQQFLFRGGYVHGNINYLDEVMKCIMIDITSSYPYSMFAKYYPVSEWKLLNLSTQCWKYGQEPPEVFGALYNKCCKITAVYYGLHAKTEHSYESVSKVMEYVPYEDDPTKGLDNGRIRNAEVVKVMQTELDYFIYQMLYDYDMVEIEKIEVSERGKLPAFLLNCLAGDYKEKNKLKSSGYKDTSEYALKKADVNTYFGMLVKAVYSELIGYDGAGWTEGKQTFCDMQKELNERFLSYDWGIWVCAHSRYKLVEFLTRIEAIGGHVLYYDTDSLKIAVTEKTLDDILQLIVDENTRIRKENEKNSFLQDPAFYGELGDGIGEWDIEAKDKEGKAVLVEFKTLGSKRYLYEINGEKHLCVAGLPKAAQDLLPDDCFTQFSKYGFSFKGEEVDKLRPIFQDDPYEVEITDDYGNTETIACKSGITLVPVDFEVSENKLYNLFKAQQEYKEKHGGCLL